MSPESRLAYAKNAFIKRNAAPDTEQQKRHDECPEI